MVGKKGETVSGSAVINTSKRSSEPLPQQSESYRGPFHSTRQLGIRHTYLMYLYAVHCIEEQEAPEVHNGVVCVEAARGVQADQGCRVVLRLQGPKECVEEASSAQLPVVELDVRIHNHLGSSTPEREERERCLAFNMS